MDASLNRTIAKQKARKKEVAATAQGVRKKGNVQDGVYAELRRRLMVGHFLPGEAITLRGLASELGVSQMPVRAALRQLIAEGGLEMLPGRSVRVPIMTPQRLGELLAVRRQLEGMATAQACRNMSGAELAALQKIHINGMRLIKANKPAQLLANNQKFHFTLYGYARSWVLMPMIEMLWLQAGPFLHLAQNSIGSKLDGRHHVQLMRALEKRDESAAQRAIERDIVMAGQILQKTKFSISPYSEHSK